MSLSLNLNEEVDSSVTPEFVKKLHRMLEDEQYHQIVDWSDSGESFIIKDPNEFAKEVLPKHFKHNNISSFVRQLNKYDFHKVKGTDGKGKGTNDNVWEFKHPNFSRTGLEQLSAIKRKVPTKKTETPSTKSDGELQNQIENLTKVQRDLTGYLQTLTRNYEMVVREVVSVKKNLATQDQFIQTLLQLYNFSQQQQPQIFTSTRGEIEASPFQNQLSDDKEKKTMMIQDSHFPPILSHSMSNSEASYYSNWTNQIHPMSQMPNQNTNLNQSANHINLNLNQNTNQMPQLSQSPQIQIQSQNSNQPYNFNAQSSSQFNWIQDNNPENQKEYYQQCYAQASLNQMEDLSKKLRNGEVSLEKLGEGLTVHSVGMLKPKSPDSKDNTVKVYRSTFVPAWSVPPKVLLVEDDATCRTIASRLLKIFGCSFEIAHDGEEAVKKMNLSKYDLVLMDIVMPNMDGVSATSHIRQFDPSTPVISMTSNTTRDDCLKYMENGMNDVLPKPFSRDALLEILLNFCAHLKRPEPLLRHLAEQQQLQQQQQQQQQQQNDPENPNKRARIQQLD